MNVRLGIVLCDQGAKISHRVALIVANRQFHGAGQSPLLPHEPGQIERG